MRLSRALDVLPIEPSPTVYMYVFIGIQGVTQDLETGGQNLGFF